MIYSKILSKITAHADEFGRHPKFLIMTRKQYYQLKADYNVYIINNIPITPIIVETSKEPTIFGVKILMNDEVICI